MNLLDLVLLLPLVGFVVVLLLPRESSRMTALILSLGIFVLSLGLLGPYLGGNAPAGYVISTDVPWINYPPIRYHVGMDGLITKPIGIEQLRATLDVWLKDARVEQRA